MSILIDIILALVFIGFVIFLSKYGFDKTVEKIGKVWLSLITAIVLGPIIANCVQKWFLLDMLSDGIFYSLSAIVAKNPNGYNLAQLFQNLPENILHILESNHLSLAELEATYGPSTIATTDILQAISLKIAIPSADLIANIFSHFFCIIATALFFKWLSMENKKNNRIKFFKVMDHVTGFFIGIAAGYCAVFGISIVLHTVFQFISILDSNSTVLSIYDNSYVFKFVNEFDLWGNIKAIFAKLADQFF